MFNVTMGLKNKTYTEEQMALLKSKVIWLESEHPCQDCDMFYRCNEQDTCEALVEYNNNRKPFIEQGVVEEAEMLSEIHDAMTQIGITKGYLSKQILDECLNPKLLKMINTDYHDIYRNCKDW